MALRTESSWLSRCRFAPFSAPSGEPEILPSSLAPNESIYPHPLCKVPSVALYHGPGPVVGFRVSGEAPGVVGTDKRVDDRSETVGAPEVYGLGAPLSSLSLATAVVLILLALTAFETLFD